MEQTGDHAGLRDALVAAARGAFTALRQEHANETFYAFALFASPFGNRVLPAANSEEGLRRTIERYVANGYEASGLDSELRWNPAEWAYYGHGEEFFEIVRRLLGEAASHGDVDVDEDAWAREADGHFNAFVESLERLDRDGFFGSGAERERVTLLLAWAGQDKSRLLGYAARLNPEPVCKRLAEQIGRLANFAFIEIGTSAVYEMKAVGTSADGRVLACCGGYHVFAFDVNNQTEVLRETTGSDGIWGGALSPDGCILAVGWRSSRGEGAGIQRWAIRSKRRLLPEITAAHGGFSTVAFSRDSSLITAAAPDNRICAWDARSGKLQWQVGDVADAISCIAFSPDGALLASVGYAAGSLRLWDPATQRSLCGCDDAGESLAFSPDGKLLAVASGRADVMRDDIRLWDVASHSLAGRLDCIGHGVCAIAFSPCGRYVACATGPQPIVQLWELLSARRILACEPGYESVNALVFLQDRPAIGIVGRGPNRRPVLLWDISDAISPVGSKN